MSLSALDSSGAQPGAAQDSMLVCVHTCILGVSSQDFQPLPLPGSPHMQLGRGKGWAKAGAQSLAFLLE